MARSTPTWCSTFSWTPTRRSGCSFSLSPSPSSCSDSPTSRTSARTCRRHRATRSHSTRPSRWAGSSSTARGSSRRSSCLSSSSPSRSSCATRFSASRSARRPTTRTLPGSAASRSAGSVPSPGVSRVGSPRWPRCSMRRRRARSTARVSARSCSWSRSGRRRSVRSCHSPGRCSVASPSV